MCPDLANFYHMGEILQFGHFVGLFSIGQIFNQLWQIVYAVGHILIAVNSEPIICQSIANIINKILHSITMLL